MRSPQHGNDWLSPTVVVGMLRLCDMVVVLLAALLAFITRFHDFDNYLVALYSPSFKTIFIHDRKNGQWGANLGEVPVPEIGPRIQLSAAASGEYAAMVLTDR